MLDFILPVMEKLEHEAALALPVVEDDDELDDIWRSGLLETQTDDCSYLMSLFGDEYRESGIVRIEVEKADRVLRASSAIRLKVRETLLAHVSDSDLEGADFDFATLTDPDRKGLAVYMLFAALQEVIIQQLDG